MVEEGGGKGEGGGGECGLISTVAVLTVKVVVA